MSYPAHFIYMRYEFGVFACNAFMGTFAFKAIRLFNRLFGVLLSRRGGFDPCPVRVGFALNKPSMGQVFIGILRLCPVGVFIPVLHTRPNLLAALTSCLYTSAPHSS